MCIAISFVNNTNSKGLSTKVMDLYSKEIQKNKEITLKYENI